MSSALVALIVAALLLPTSAAAGLVGWLTHQRQQRRQKAADIWQAVTLRNGITAPSPFHPPRHPVNAPGMVEPPIHPWELQPVRPEPPPPPSDWRSTDHGTRDLPVSELVDEPELHPPLALAEQPTAEERAIVHRLIRAGTGKKKTIKRVWDISAGGSPRYRAASARFDLYHQEVTPHA